MNLKIYSAPAIEPVSLQEIKEHLRLDCGGFSDNLIAVQSIVPGSHVIANDYVTHVGTYVDVLGYQSITVLDAGANGATGTVDAKIQESDDHITWTDWSSGAFTQVTTANDNATYKIAYTGIKQYIRPVAKVLLAACEFGVQILKYSSDTTEDNLLTDLIEAARRRAEEITDRQLITATWDYFPQNWPGRWSYRGTGPVMDYGIQNNFLDNYSIRIPLGNLQSVTYVKWKNTGGTETTLTENTDYIVETNGEQYGRIVLPWGVIWPSGMLYPSNPISIRFVCGYGATSSAIPAGIRTAIKMMVGGMFENREDMLLTQGRGIDLENKTVMALLTPKRLWDF